MIQPPSSTIQGVENIKNRSDVRREVKAAVDGIPSFWDRLADANHRALLLDYDGTLAPFKVDRMAAVPLDGVRELLEEIVDEDNTFVAVVSGRPVSEVRQLLGVAGIPIAGTHGWERYTPESGLSTPELSPEQTQLLNDAFELAAQSVDESQIERKVATVAVHTRALGPAESTRLLNSLREGWSSLSRPGLSEMRDFDGGIEFRLVGRTKGNAVEDLLTGIADDAFAVYIGDDDTDEDAFLEMAERGFGIRVGANDRPTEATGRLHSIEEVRQFLWTWINLTS